MAAVQRLRTHATARKIRRFNQNITGRTELDAIIAVASHVDWLISQPGRIIVADASGLMLCKVWNAESFDPTRFDGPAISNPIIHRIGHYVIESVRELGLEVRSHFLTVEAPE